jgi:predicted RNase H-like HicB family nuclease
MGASYIALLRKENGSDYGVEFPDFPGCVSAGRTLEEARRAAHEALELHLEGKGAFNVRVSPTLHRGIALRAAREGRSLNEVVKAALELTHRKVVPDAQAAPGKLRRRAGAAKGSQKKPERSRGGRGRA